MPCVFSHVDSHVFLAPRNIPISGCMSLFIHSPSKGQLDCFPLWQLNKAAGFQINSNFQLLGVSIKSELLDQALSVRSGSYVTAQLSSGCPTVLHPPAMVRVPTAPLPVSV